MHVEKTPPDKKKSVTPETPQNRGDKESLFQYTDHRPEAIVQRKLQGVIHDSPRVNKLQSTQKMANSSSLTIQRTKWIYPGKGWDLEKDWNEEKKSKPMSLWVISKETKDDRDTYPNPNNPRYSEVFERYKRPGVTYDQNLGSFSGEEIKGHEQPKEFTDHDTSPEAEVYKLLKQARILLSPDTLRDPKLVKRPERGKGIHDLVRKIHFYKARLKGENRPLELAIEKLESEIASFFEGGRSLELFDHTTTMHQPPNVVCALFAHSSAGPYYAFPTTYSKKIIGEEHGILPKSYEASLADGQYQFAILPSKPTEVLIGKGGHSTLTNNRPVIYAGTVYFHKGKLLYWNNDTGHYSTTPERASQTLIAPTDDLGGGILPLRKFNYFEPK